MTNKNKEKLAEKLDSEIHKNDEILWENGEVSEKNSERSENLDAFFALNLTDEMNESEGQQSNLNNESEWSSEKNSSEIWEKNLAEENAKKIRDEILGLKTETNLWTQTDQYRKGKSKKLKKIYKMEDNIGKSEEENSSKAPIDKQNLNSNAETKGQTSKKLAENSNLNNSMLINAEKIHQMLEGKSQTEAKNQKAEKNLRKPNKKQLKIGNYEGKGQNISKNDPKCTLLMRQLGIYKIRGNVEKG
ncbi:hypothetical protein niasHT_034444 [Heterodera trifolii]|uniref:Uncharacterized protein n=1 Tax=Heterodera trifolii TaxID=157864 RepID=A0ABD2HP50_9BILA